MTRDESILLHLANVMGWEVRRVKVRIGFYRHCVTLNHKTVYLGGGWNPLKIWNDAGMVW